MTPKRLAEIKEYMAKHDQQCAGDSESGHPQTYVGFPARNAMMRELVIEVERLRNLQHLTLRRTLEDLVNGLCRGADTSRGEPTYWLCDGDGRVQRARAALTVEVP